MTSTKRKKYLQTPLLILKTGENESVHTKSYLVDTCFVHISPGYLSGATSKGHANSATFMVSRAEASCLLVAGEAIKDKNT